MAAEYTAIADIVEPIHFDETVRELTATKSRFVQSGVVAMNPIFNELANQGGRQVEIAFWQDLPGDAEAEIDDGTAIEPEKRLQAQMTAYKFFLKKAWGFTDLGVQIAGSDPLADITQRVAEWWARQEQSQILIPTLTGLFEATDGVLGADATDPHLLNVSIAAGDDAADDNLIGPDSIIDANVLLGDSWDSVGALVMHSKPFSRLQKLNLIEFEQVANQDIRIARYQGKQVIVDDGAPKVAGGTSGFVYTTYLLGLGSFGMGVGTPKVPVEVERQGLESQEALIVRRNLFLHPIGIRYIGTLTAAHPTVAELENGTNWELVYEHKNVPIVALTTNG